MTYRKRFFAIFCMGFWLLSGLPLFSQQSMEQSSVEISIEDYERLKQIFQALEKKYQLQASLLDNSKLTIQDLQKQLEDSKSELKRLTELLEQSKQEIEDKRKYIEALMLELSKSKVDSAELNLQLKNYQAILTDLNSRWVNLSTLYEKASKSLTNLEEAINKKIKNLETQRNIFIVTSIVEFLILVFFGFKAGSL